MVVPLVLLSTIANYLSIANKFCDIISITDKLDHQKQVAARTVDRKRQTRDEQLDMGKDSRQSQTNGGSESWHYRPSGVKRRDDREVVNTFITRSH